MVHSMTGFAVKTLDLGRVTLHIEFKSVNSRYLDLAFRITEDLRQAEPLLRELISSRVGRGKVECRLNWQQNDTAVRDLAVNAALLEALAEAQSAVQTALPSAAPLSVNEVLRWPGMLADDPVTFETIQPHVTSLAAAALDELVATRRREGERLAELIKERVAAMRELVAQVAPRLPQIVADYREKLATKLREAVATLDEERIRQELGVFSTRIDVAEELDRLNTHLDEVLRVVKKGGTAGKRLDFLMQELNREANTLASKSVASDLSAIAIELKLYIEQMREQVQNIE